MNIQNCANGGDKANSNSNTRQELPKSLKEVKGTPFYTLKVKEGYVLLIGTTQITENFYNTRKEAEEALKKDMWTIVLNLSILTATKMKEAELKNKKTMSKRVTLDGLS